MKYPREIKPYRQKGIWWLPEGRGLQNEGKKLNVLFSFEVMKTFQNEIEAVIAQHWIY